MEMIEADSGENIVDFIQRAKNKAEYEVKTILARFNDVCIKIYPQSFVQDLYDKFDMASEFRKDH